MREHNWSDPVCVYESACMVKCDGCGAVIFCEYDPKPSDVQDARLPTDCDEALPYVVLEEYGEFLTDPWSDEDVGRWTWGARS